MSRNATLTVIFLLSCISGSIFGQDTGGLDDKCNLEERQHDDLMKQKEQTLAACRDPSRMLKCAEESFRWDRVFNMYCGGPTPVDVINEPPFSVNNVKISLSTLPNFLDDTVKDIGKRGESAHFESTLTPIFHPQTHRILSLQITGVTTLPQKGGGRASPLDEALIDQAISLLAQHEQRHADIFLRYVNQAAKEMGKARGANVHILNKWFCSGKDTEFQAQMKLDAEEGMITSEIVNGRERMVSRAKDKKQIHEKDYKSPDCPYKPPAAAGR